QGPGIRPGLGLHYIPARFRVTLGGLAALLRTLIRPIVERTLPRLTLFALLMPGRRIRAAGGCPRARSRPRPSSPRLPHRARTAAAPSIPVSPISGSSGRARLFSGQQLAQPADDAIGPDQRVGGQADAVTVVPDRVDPEA